MWQAGCAPGSVTGLDLVEDSEVSAVRFLLGFVVTAGAYKGNCFPDCTQRSLGVPLSGLVSKT